MSSYQIIKQDDGRFALYQDEVLINTYTRKDSAVRRMKKLQSVGVVASEQQDLLDFRVYADGTVQDADDKTYSFMSDDFSVIKAESEKSAFEIWVAREKFAYSNKQSEATAHALTQCASAGAARGVARSPP